MAIINNQSPNAIEEFRCNILDLIVKSIALYKFPKMLLKFVEYDIIVFGHENIRSTHKSTWEITSESYLSVSGDCIIGTSAPHGSFGLPYELKEHLLKGGHVEISIYHGDEIIISGRFCGSKDMTFTHENEMVFRKSNFVDDRTCGINGTFSSKDIPRAFISQIQSSKVSYYIKIKHIE